MIRDINKLVNCPGCGVKPNNFHKSGCDVERCALCGRQLIICDCIYKLNGLDRFGDMEFTHPDVYNDGPTEDMYEAYNTEVEKYGGFLPWAGIWPGVKECREFGWYSKFIPNKGHIPCSIDDPEASENLNKIYSGACYWDKEKRRFVLRNDNAK